MNIALDTSSLVISKKRGIGNYAIGLYNELFRIDQENRYYLFVWKEQTEFEDLEYGNNVQTYFTGLSYKEVYSEEQYEQVVTSFLNENKIDVFYFPNAVSLDMPLVRKKWFGDTKLAATIHDIIPWMMKEKFLTSGETEIKYRSYYENLKEYDILFANSEKTKEDTESHFEVSSIINISMSSHKKVKEREGDEQAWEIVRKKYGINGTYILTVGGFSHNKNYPRLVQAYNKFVNKCNGHLQILLTGNVPANVKENLNFYLKNNKLEEKVIVPGVVSDEELEMLYFNAHWVVFPSLYEGFGMPVIEAWQHGVPVLTSGTTSLKEISDGAAIHVDPSDVESITDGLCRLQKMTESEREEYIRLGKEKLNDFSWNKTAKLWIKEIKKLK